MNARNELAQLEQEWVAEQKRLPSQTRMTLLQVVAKLLMVLGVILILLSSWLFDLAGGVVAPIRAGRESVLHTAGFICLLLGSVLIAGGLVFAVFYLNPRIRRLNEAHTRYATRRLKLLEEIAGTPQE